MRERNVVRFTARNRRPPRRRSPGRVFLVGAGPGDPGLLTVKATRLLAACDVVVYDELVHPAALMYARCGAELVAAGRRAGGRGVAQERVNEIIVARALEGK